MSVILRWEKPSAPGEYRYAPSSFDSYAVAEALRECPQQWAVVAEDPANTGLATIISGGRFRAFRPAGSFEAVHRTVKGVRTIYARYVGTEAGL